jgi:hypothetical protein
VALDHYYRVVDDDPVAAQRLEGIVERSSDAMLASVRNAAEHGLEEEMIFPLPDPIGKAMEGARML